MAILTLAAKRCRNEVAGSGRLSFARRRRGEGILLGEHLAACDFEPVGNIEQHGIQCLHEARSSREPARIKHALARRGIDAHELHLH